MVPAIQLFSLTSSMAAVAASPTCCYKDTMQEHQTIPTNATASKDSDKISISVIMAGYEIISFYIFQVNLRNQEIEI